MQESELQPQDGCLTQMVYMAIGFGIALLCAAVAAGLWLIGSRGAALGPALGMLFMVAAIVVAVAALILVIALAVAGFVLRAPLVAKIIGIVVMSVIPFGQLVVAYWVGKGAVMLVKQRRRTAV